jgi:hypothetical protein
MVSIHNLKQAVGQVTGLDFPRFKPRLPDAPSQVGIGAKIQRLLAETR